MRTAPRDKILIGDRQRSEIKKKPLADLVESILHLGLMSPVLLAHSKDRPGYFDLVAGGRRLTAIDQIYSDGGFFLCEGNPVLDGEVPYILFGDVDLIPRFEAELEENLIREELPWQDRNKALARLHQLRLEQNPTQTKKETAQEIVNSQAEDKKVSEKHAERTLAQAIIIEENMESPQVANARNATEAYNAALKVQAARYEAELYRRNEVAASGQVEIEMVQGNVLEALEQEPDNTYDLILSDPPYGVNVHKQNLHQRTGIVHAYEDSAEYARDIMMCMLREGFRITRPRANIVLFTDIDHFAFLVDAAKRMGWTPWRYPIIWQKSKSEGLSPWQASGFIHTYDIVFWATKGQRGVNKPLLDILDYARVPKGQREHAAEKPLDLLTKLIKHMTLPDDRVIDPCMGSGSTVIACSQMARHCKGVELDPAVVELAQSRLYRLQNRKD